LLGSSWRSASPTSVARAPGRTFSPISTRSRTKVEQDDKCFLLRSPPRPAASIALAATGVALPPTERQVNQA
jgi:hypothetical protein